MSAALEEACKILTLGHDANAREIIASRVIELARRGEHCPAKLCDLLVAAGLENATMPRRVDLMRTDDDRHE
jgi:hypothetical protein